ncbi:MAG TPA: NAD-dependent protein deacetylase [Polyangiaceae bacterium]|nr:NAD-dependent protein deacetylase [Polyangiaceae bacterium]
MPSPWVPAPVEGWELACERLVGALAGKRFCLLSGAGCSTESGIPDYRGGGTARRARSPIRFREFIQDELGRRRYWARSTLGWPRFRSAEPSRAHLGAASLEKGGRLTGIVTQNVDRLHTRAGAERVVELHGALAEVVCLDCGALESRDELQVRLLDANPGWLEQVVELAPDGDAELPVECVRDFRVCGCVRCGGVLKPRVVFFGEGVPVETVRAAYEHVDAAEALVVAGSSLAVFSGYRFVRRALERGCPVHVVNIGPTRADQVATERVAGAAGEVLERLAARLC